MSPSRSEVLAWEERWSLRTGIVALVAVALVLAGILIASQAIGNTDGEAEFLRSVDQHRGDEIFSSVLQAIGLALLAWPLYFLFGAAKARNPTMRGQLVGVVIAAPLFLALAAIITGVSYLDAASDFLAKEVAGSSDHANNIASDSISGASLRTLGAGLGIAGVLGFTIGMLYTCLQAMRVGLLTRFWGSLGVALGAVSILFFPYNTLWFVYLGFLLLGRVPGNRPPAWAAGEAIPWPTPGEKAAADLSPPPKDPPADDNPTSTADEPASAADLVPTEDPEASSEKGQSQ
jgi:hypothetical protein